MRQPRLRCGTRSNGKSSPGWSASCTEPRLGFCSKSTFRGTVKMRSTSLLLYVILLISSIRPTKGWIIGPLCVTRQSSSPQMVIFSGFRPSAGFAHCGIAEAVILTFVLAAGEAHLTRLTAQRMCPFLKQHTDAFGSTH